MSTVSLLLLSFFSYAKFLSKQGKIREALQRMKIAQEIFVKYRGTYEPEYVDILNNLAVLSLEVGYKMIFFYFLIQCN